MLNVRAIFGRGLRPISRRPLTAYEGVLHFSAVSKVLYVCSCYIHWTFFYGYYCYAVKTHELATAPTGLYFEISPSLIFV